MTDIARSTPEAQGLSSQAVEAFIEALGRHKLELHSLMIVRHAHVITEAWWHPYQRHEKHLLYSLSKSFTATAVGFAIDEGLLSLDDKVADFFPAEQPESLNEGMASLTVAHCLSMATGHKDDTLERLMGHPQGWVAGFLDIPTDGAPGSMFTYNNGATFMLAAILAKVTGLDLVAYLRPRLFEPLGIDDISWDRNAEGLALGFSGLYLRTEAIARFGLLYLNKGMWNGVQVLPKRWVTQATSKHIVTHHDDRTGDWAEGYGYQFWRCRHGAYRGDGAFGQFCVVMPEQRVVIAATSGEEDMQAILNLCWQHLLPAFKPAQLIPDDRAQQRLKQLIEQLKYPPLQGASSSSRLPALYQQRYVFSDMAIQDRNFKPFNSLRVQPREDGGVLVFEGDECFEVAFAYQYWLNSETGFYSSTKAQISASAAWVQNDELHVHVKYRETPHSLSLQLHFAPTTLKLCMQWNVHFQEKRLPDCEGVLRQDSDAS